MVSAHLHVDSKEEFNIEDPVLAPYKRGKGVVSVCCAINNVKSPLYSMGQHTQAICVSPLINELIGFKLTIK